MDNRTAGEKLYSYDYWQEARELGFESPIEQRIFYALEDVFGKDTVKKQVQIGKYRADLLLLGRFVIEADGRDFHDEWADRVRDGELLAHGFITIRCSGKLIRYHHRRVAKRIKEIVDWHESFGDDRSRDRSWKIYEQYHLGVRDNA